MGLKPEFKITANSKDITSVIESSLNRLVITDESGMKSDTLSIDLADTNNQIALPDVGAEIEIFMGYDGELSRVGIYIIDEIELSGAPDVMILTGKAAPLNDSNNFSALQTQKTRSFDQKTLGDIVNTIASEHGMKPVITPSLSNFMVEHVDQVNESDMNFLTRLSRDHDATMKPAGGHLFFIKKGDSKTASGKSLGSLTLNKKDVSSWNCSIVSRSKYKRVDASYRDTENAVDVQMSTGTGEPVFKLPFTFPSKEEAVRASQARMEFFKRGASTVSLSLPGNLEAMADGRLLLGDFREGVRGEWLITRVEHSLTDTNFVTSIDAESPTTF